MLLADGREGADGELLNSLITDFNSLTHGERRPQDNEVEPPWPSTLGLGRPHTLPVLLGTCSEPGSGTGVLGANSPGGPGAFLSEPWDSCTQETCSDRLLGSQAQNRPRKKLWPEPPDSGLLGPASRGQFGWNFLDQ